MGKLFNTSLILAKIYGPNGGMHHNSYKLLLGRDFNCVLHAQRDSPRLRSNNTLLSAAVAINTLLCSYGLSDPWWIKKSNYKAILLFSTFIIVTPGLIILLSITSSIYHSILLEDHSTVFFSSQCSAQTSLASRPPNYFYVNILEHFSIIRLTSF